MYLDLTGRTSAVSCKLCPKGTYSSAVGVGDVNGCIPCGKGYYGTIEGATNNNTCVACASGTFNANPVASSCSNCRAGTYSIATAAQTNASCLLCPIGTESASEAANSQSACVACKLGYYSNEGFAACLPCNKGTATRNGTCIPCLPGFIASEIGQTDCVACSPGTYQPNSNAQYCLPCPSKSYASVPASKACIACETGNRTICPLGSSMPLVQSNSSTISFLRGSQSTSEDPFFTIRQNPSKMDVYSGGGVARVVLLCIGIAVGVIIAVVALIMYCIDLKVNSYLAYLDVFGLKHRVNYLSSPVNKQTFVGAAFTFIFLVGAVTIFGLLLVDLISDNTVERSYITPQQTLPGNISGQVQGTIRLLVFLHNYNDLQCNPSVFTASGLTPNVTLQSARFENATCMLDLVCANCILVGNNQRINFEWNRAFSMASIIEYYLFIPHFLPNQYFFMYEALAPESEDLIFKGSRATEFTLSLTKAFRTTLLPFHALSSLFSTSDPLGINRTTIGYIANRFPTQFGSTQTEQTFA